MHELSVTQALVDMAVSEAAKAGATSIDKINIVVGELTGIVGESVQFYFELISAGTLAEGAQLSFRYVPAEFHCDKCGYNYNRNGFSFRCPKCGNAGVITKRGNELYIENIEVSFDGDKGSKKHT
ncbi:hydrogenase nickel incorporation protein HypA/HybF [Caldanaerobius fijiensis DSM 17918]|uniref:Hydrogenase maturation factor HypA n=1 Tax=Caldanaerobius fijiensis DSM 17918 TaxID=1121256 RepID=A0A1M4W5E1_9THEO|nr:hydrogenase maturation nickel metallochaperone HypA [Caldanaerobius fijiensis]SHE76182.1 hydrogenase nickel incorporation protein HypA/HybF [Caldanaerobius fijiensis DSM 17918]